ncbi:FKBP-type peptidyl-prolyl cis-trans isomerase [Thalassotalea marina]|uniref:Peptidyl-prolyl cis-trans isomerase n=1 Tax=Thalassotalea marina TaxID=1673741 RepID=A0A919EJ19_9GAMM|nr:FKBP-type peptidyl-prolyl cis-trans isomerase [Thalassotalea marina]GHF89578.1 peptidyl-prolyl cis-trans isomerase [Thalassotalea marina]
MKYILLAIIIAFAIFWFKRLADNKAIAEENNKIAQQFLAENKLKDGVVETESGLQYQVLRRGEGTEHPSATSKVTVHYHGTLIDGTVFDSSLVRKQSISFGLNQVIKGWTEGVQLMRVGDKFKFFIPSNLAYGNNSTGKITAGSLLIFEVELLAIN